MVCNTMFLLVQIDLFPKSCNAPVLYTTIHHFVTEICTHVHIFVTEWCIVGYLSDALWDLLDKSIACRIFGPKPLPKPMLIYCHL